MDEIGIEKARNQLGEIVDRARLADEPTSITRQGKPAVVVISADWYTAVTEFIARSEDEMRAFMEWQEHAVALRKARRVLGLLPQDRRVVHHIDGDPRNNDPANLRIIDPRENRTGQ